MILKANDTWQVTVTTPGRRRQGTRLLAASSPRLRRVGHFIGQSPIAMLLNANFNSHCLQIPSLDRVLGIEELVAGGKSSRSSGPYEFSVVEAWQPADVKFAAALDDEDEDEDEDLEDDDLDEDDDDDVEDEDEDLEEEEDDEDFSDDDDEVEDEDGEDDEDDE